jgi:O-methyltransferase
MPFKTPLYQTLLRIGPFGYECLRWYRRLAARGSPSYQRLNPIADYAPWMTDPQFLEIYHTIQPYTLVDMYRCYELWTLVEQSQKLAGSLIEIGVWRGGTGALIAQRAKLSGITDTIYLCDTFTGVVKASAHDPLYKGGEHHDTSLGLVEDLVYNQLKLEHVKILQGIFPEETANVLDHESFRFCHIDVDVYHSAKDITEWLWNKLTIGGMIVYDDYGFFGYAGVTTYVEEQRHALDRLVLYNLNGHAVIIKIFS